MSNPGVESAAEAGAAAPPVAATASVLRIFVAFLVIGSTSFGGPVPYLREHLVTRRRWLDDKTFVELLSISQSLPGLNATNMAILVGDRLAGPRGALAGVIGMCLPGAIIMFVVGVLYREHGAYAWTTAALKGVAAASVGLVLATVVQLSEKSLDGRFDFVFVAVTVVAVEHFHVSVPVALIGVGAAAILWHRPRRGT
ncbi:chromate transporter [Roseiarcus fermentans]|uniref:Chromate transporter n=1 Tax=Roseiarcus fermentans TaxID=1473586 RepID=A0A366FST4_9HYPH|nr:chromate transporter [Roseiarcus fermentans]RBP16805.1 chromate transporter [Roseiarcus fermentans]